MPNHLITLLVTVGMDLSIYSSPLSRASTLGEPASLFQVNFEHEVSVVHLKMEVGFAFQLYGHEDERVWEKTLSVS